MKKEDLLNIKINFDFDPNTLEFTIKEKDYDKCMMDFKFLMHKFEYDFNTIYEKYAIK